MSWLLGLLCVATVINGSIQKSTPESTFYTAAVVEFVVNPRIRLDERTTNYISFINHVDAKNVDIMVFPESTLTDRTEAQIVPDASAAEKVIPCENDEYTGNPIQRISCAARDNRMYVVINLTMKRNCTIEKETTNDDRPCAENDLNLYNTNVVFDRNGAVISTYRKVHLFGERGINTTILPDVSWFDTDFNVRFGHFICFDLIFDLPSLKLIDLGIKNFAYPTMWFSEIPFLTAVQAQLAWAYKHNVNFLAAGANNPAGGSTGSGIYAGKQGAIKAIMLGTSESQMLISEISKIPGETANIQPLLKVHSTPAVLMIRDQLEPYKYVSIDSANESEQIYELCHEERNMCCHFALKLAPSAELAENSVTYSYVAAAYHGNRTFSNVVDADVLSCSIFSCINNEDIKTCGVLYPSNANVVNHHRFTQIKISGIFPTTKTLIMPNTLDIGLIPLASNNYKYNESDEHLMDKARYKNITIELTEFDHHLMTFGIFGREFNSSSTTHSTAAAAAVVLVTVGIFVNFF